MKRKVYLGIVATVLVSILAGCTQNSGVPLSTQVMMNVLKPIVGDPADPKNTQHVSFLLYKKDLTPEFIDGLSKDICQKYPNARMHFIDQETKKEIAGSSRKACS